MNINIKELITKISKNDYTCSEGWKNMTKELKFYLENGNLDLYRVNNINPQIFSWRENSDQNIQQLSILKKNKESIFYNTLLKNNNYGPQGIKLSNNIQLDRVAHTCSVYNLVNILNLNLNNNEIILEFGGGTGQMADILSDLQFKGKHIVYELPLMTILQKYFIDKLNVKNKYILDDEELDIISGTNYLPCNQTKSEKFIMDLPNINFIATHSLTETDIDTRNKFAEYMLNFSRIYIVYWLVKTIEGDFIDNEEYIQMIKKKLEYTHYTFIGENYGKGKVFMAVKKELITSNILLQVQELI